MSRFQPSNKKKCSGTPGGCQASPLAGARLQHCAARVFVKAFHGNVVAPLAGAMLHPLAGAMLQPLAGAMLQHCAARVFVKAFHGNVVAPLAGARLHP